MSDTPGAERPTLGVPTGAEIQAWISERWENCLRIATLKEVPDKSAWLEDAAYFSAALGQLRQRDALAERVKEADEYRAKISAMLQNGVALDWPFIYGQIECLETLYDGEKVKRADAESRLASLAGELKRLTGLNWPESKQVSTITLPNGEKWATCPAIAEHIASLTDAAKRLVRADWLVRALVRIAIRNLADANKRRGEENDWPAGQEWHDLGHTSQHAFMRAATKEAGIPHDEYRLAIEAVCMAGADLDTCWQELEQENRVLLAAPAEIDAARGGA